MYMRTHKSKTSRQGSLLTNDQDDPSDLWYSIGTIAIIIITTFVLVISIWILLTMN